MKGFLHVLSVCWYGVFSVLLFTKLEQWHVGASAHESLTRTAPLPPSQIARRLQRTHAYSMKWKLMFAYAVYCRNTYPESHLIVTRAVTMSGFPCGTKRSASCVNLLPFFGRWGGGRGGGIKLTSCNSWHLRFLTWSVRGIICMCQPKENWHARVCFWQADQQKIGSFAGFWLKELYWHPTDSAMSEKIYCDTTCSPF